MTAVVLATAGAPVVARAAAGAQPRGVPILSRYETARRSVSRDIGVSVALPNGHALWLFGDTTTFVLGSRGWKASGFVDGGTALYTPSTPSRVPRGVEFPSATPTRFLPAPRDVYLPDGSGRRCTYRTAAYPARWVTGAALVPTDRSEILIAYTESCIQHAKGGGTTITPEGWGYAIYNWKAHRFGRGPVDVFKPKTNGAAVPSSRLFVAPVFDRQRLWFFSSECNAPYGSCDLGQAWFVTMPFTTRALNNPASYTLQSLPIALPSIWAPLGVSVKRYPTGWRLIEMTSIYGTYKIFSAAHPDGPWHLHAQGTLPGCPAQHGFCWTVQGHPELSTTKHMFISYTDPDSGPGGHVVVSALPSA